MSKRLLHRRWVGTVKLQCFNAMLPSPNLSGVRAMSDTLAVPYSSHFGNSLVRGAGAHQMVAPWMNENKDKYHIITTRDS